MPKQVQQPKVALVYDRVNTAFGGAEDVLLALHTAYPKAPLYTAVYDPKKATWAKVFPLVKPSFLNKFPWLNKLHRWIPFLMPIAFESFDFSSYDIIISITSAEAKGILTLPHQLHVCYLLTPPRYLYQDREHSLQSHYIFKIPGMKWLAEKLLNYLTWWDQQAIFRPDTIIPISQRVGQRIKKYYPNIKATTVIYPPVTMASLDKENNIRIENQPTNYLLMVSRLVSYKHLEQAIVACNNLKKNLVIVGDGPERKKLQTFFTNYTFWYPFISETKLHTLYTQCDALLMPGEEDFGIVGLEANSYGKPVLVNCKSGVAECIDHTFHGIHISQEKTAEIEKAIISLENTKFNPSQLIHNAKKYDTNTFVQQFTQVVQYNWQQKQKETL